MNNNQTMQTFKVLIFSAFLSITLQANASISDWIERAVTNTIGLDASILEVSELRYSNDASMDYLRSERYSTTFVNVTGKITNNSDEDTIKTIVFKYDVLECVSANDCITIIDEDEKKWRTNIPPGQSRYFEHRIAYNKGDSLKDIFFRQHIKYVYPYKL